MRVYLAARYSRRAEIACIRTELQRRGMVVQARWLDGLHDNSPNDVCAYDDTADIDECHALIAFTEERRSIATSGGRHFEAGYAHALGKPVIVVGPEENVFYSLAFVRFLTLEAMLEDIIEGTFPGICQDCGCTEERSCGGCAWMDERAVYCTRCAWERRVEKGGGR